MTWLEDIRKYCTANDHSLTVVTLDKHDLRSLSFYFNGRSSVRQSVRASVILFRHCTQQFCSQNCYNPILGYSKVFFFILVFFLI